MTCACPACGQPVPDVSSLLVGELGTAVARLGRSARLSVGQARILAILRDRYPSPVAHGDVVDAIYGDASEPLDVHRGLRVQVMRLRRRLAPLGVSVRSVHGMGYALALADAPIQRRRHDRA